MGKKGKTGIGFVDNGVKAINNVGNSVGLNQFGIKQAGVQTKSFWEEAEDAVGGAVSDVSNTVNSGLSDIGNGFNAALDGAGKNLEANLQDTAKFWGSIFQGDFNNIGESLIQNSINAGTAGLINPKDRKQISNTEYNFERKQREAKEKGEAAVIQDIANQEAEKLRQNAEVISGSVKAKQRAPGKGQTLLTGQGGSNTLLSIMGR